MGAEFAPEQNGVRVNPLNITHPVVDSARLIRERSRDVDNRALRAAQKDASRARRNQPRQRHGPDGGRVPRTRKGERRPYPEMIGFGLGLRSRCLDDLLLEGLASERIPTVLSVGFGLDTRPWRLELPPELRWIEVDFADMLDYGL